MASPVDLTKQVTHVKRLIGLDVEIEFPHSGPRPTKGVRWVAPEGKTGIAYVSLGQRMSGLNLDHVIGDEYGIPDALVYLYATLDDLVWLTDPGNDVSRVLSIVGFHHRWCEV